MDALFHWDLRRRNELGSLIDAEAPHAWPYREYPTELRDAAARLVAASAGGELWFIGRSLEGVFDYLSGLASGASPWQQALVNVSLRFRDYETRALRHVLTEAGLHPQQLHQRPGPHVLCDVVSSGDTMEKLVGELAAWAGDTVGDVPAVMRKVRVVGVTPRQKSSPHAERWHQDVRWRSKFPQVAVQNVSAPWSLWDHAGNRGPKVSVWNPPDRWGEPLAPFLRA